MSQENVKFLEGLFAGAKEMDKSVSRDRTTADRWSGR